MREIIERFTKDYFIKNIGENAVVLLYYPHSPIVRPYDDYVVVNPNYIAHNKLHHLTKELLDALSEYKPNIYKGNLKRLFVDAKVAVYLRNNLIAIEPYGTRVSLEAIEVEGNFLEKLNIVNDELRLCEGCLMCIDDCPNKALDNGFNHNLCLRHLMIDYKSQMENVDFFKLDGQLIGCEICQLNCPYNAGLNPVALDEKTLSILKIENLLKSLENGKEGLKELGELVGTNYTNPNRILFFTLNSIRDKKNAKLALKYLNHESLHIREIAKRVLIRHKIPF